MSLGRELSLDAGAAVGSDHGGMACPRRKHETVARPHRHTLAPGEDEIDRTACAVENLRVAVLVLAVGVAGCVRPPVDITGFAPERGLDGAGLGRYKSPVAAVFDAQGYTSSRNRRSASRCSSTPR
jgi:hypothetical protein